LGRIVAQRVDALLLLRYREEQLRRARVRDLQGVDLRSDLRRQPRVAPVQLLVQIPAPPQFQVLADSGRRESIGDPLQPQSVLPRERGTSRAGRWPAPRRAKDGQTCRRDGSEPVHWSWWERGGPT